MFSKACRNRKFSSNSGSLIPPPPPFLPCWAKSISTFSRSRNRLASPTATASASRPNAASFAVLMLFSELRAASANSLNFLVHRVSLVPQLLSPLLETSCPLLLRARCKRDTRGRDLACGQSRFRQRGPSSRADDAALHE